MAWTRTSLALMAFGFVIERFGLFMRLISPTHAAPPHHDPSFWVGLAFVILGAVVAISADRQYYHLLSELQPIEIPRGYNVHAGPAINVIIALLGILLMVYLFAN